MCFIRSRSFTPSAQYGTEKGLQTNLTYTCFYDIIETVVRLLDVVIRCWEDNKVMLKKKIDLSIIHWLIGY